MIPAEAVKAAEDAVIEAMIEHGPDGHIDGYDKIARAALEAAAPYLFAQGASNEDGFWMISTSPEAVNRAARMTGHTPGAVRSVITALVDANDKGAEEES